MVLKYYNLQEQPFGIVPDPKFLLMSRTHREALASLTYGLCEERGFMALAAPPGMGKTTLLFRLLATLRERARTVFLFHTQCNSEDFCRYLVRDLGLEPGPDRASIHEQLNEALLCEAFRGRGFVLVVDEAQNLQPSVLETIRLLSDFETPGRKLMQIILSGQLGLLETLMRPDMEQLKQRISIVTSLQPFGAEEVRAYIEHRLKVAGYQGGPLFTEGAIRQIAEGSEGIPRNINNICFHALSLGYATKKSRIGPEVIQEVLADRELETLLQNSSLRKPLSRTVADPVLPSPSFPAKHLGFLTVFRKKLVLAGIAIVTALAVAAFGRGWVATANPARERTVANVGSGVPRIQNIAGGTQLSAAAPSSDSATPSGSKTIVVAPGQTLGGISIRYLGEYSPATLAKLQTLNPTLTSPDRILAGLELRLPADAVGVDEAEVAVPQNSPRQRSTQ